VVASSDCFVAKKLGTSKQNIKFQVTVTFHTWVRCAASGVICNIRLDDMLLELLGEVENMMIKVQLRGGPSSIFYFGD